MAGWVAGHGPLESVSRSIRTALRSVGGPTGLHGLVRAGVGRSAETAVSGVRGLQIRSVRALPRRSAGQWMPGRVVRVERASGSAAGIEALLELVFRAHVADVAVLLDRSLKRRRVMRWAMGVDGGRSAW